MGQEKSVFFFWSEKKVFYFLGKNIFQTKKIFFPTKKIFFWPKQKFFFGQKKFFLDTKFNLPKKSHYKKKTLIGKKNLIGIQTLRWNLYRKRRIELLTLPNTDDFTPERTGTRKMCGCGEDGDGESPQNSSLLSCI